MECVGFDVPKEETAFCVKDGSGKVLARGKVPMDPAALFAVLKEPCLCPARILLKAHCHLVRQRRDTQNTIRGMSGVPGASLSRQDLFGGRASWPEKKAAATA